MILPYARVAAKHVFTLGWRNRHVSALTDLPPWSGYSGPIPAQGALVSGYATYLYNNSHRYGYSISPEHGRTVEFGYERFDKALGSDFGINKYTADWHEFVNLPWKHHVLQVRLFAGRASGDVIPQRSFQLGGDFSGDIVFAPDSQTVHLRGYPENAFRGQKAALGSIEYRFPIKNLERGWGIHPVFFNRLHGAVFYEQGNAWDNGFRASELKRSVGAEARFDMMLGYVILPATLRLGVAKGLDEKGELLVITGLWLPLEI